MGAVPLLLGFVDAEEGKDKQDGPHRGKEKVGKGFRYALECRRTYGPGCMGEGKEIERGLDPGRHLIHGKECPAEKGHGSDEEVGQKGLIGMGLDEHGHGHGQGCKDKAVEDHSQPERRIAGKHHAKAQGDCQNHPHRKKCPGDAGQNLAGNVSQASNGGGLEFLEDPPVESGDVDFAGDGKGLGHAAHGNQPRYEELEITAASDLYMSPHAQSKGHEVEKGRHGHGGNLL